MAAPSLSRHFLRVAAGWISGRPRLTQCIIHLTFRCNLSCAYCGYPKLRLKELTTAEWLDIIDGLAGLGCRRVSLSGGEPLLRPDLPMLIGRVRDRGMTCLVASNGLLVPERIDDLARVNMLVLSLDALGEANDLVRGTGAAESVLRAFRAARRRGLPVKLNAVMTSDSLEGLSGLLEFVRREKAALTVNPVRSGNPEQWGRGAELKPPDADIRKVLLRLAAESRRNRRLLYSNRTYLQAASWPDYSQDFLEKGDGRLTLGRRPGPKCQAGKFYFHIRPDGKSVPCSIRMTHGPFGDAAGEGVEAAWRKLHRHPCVDCYTPCKLEMNYLYSGRPSVLLNFAVRNLFS